MPNTQATYKAIFDQAIAKGKIDIIKEILYKFNVPGNRFVIHNTAVILTKSGDVPKNLYNRTHVLNALDEMEQTVYQN